jgi:hypothetical protein
LIKNIVDPYVTDIGEKHIKIKNDSNRTVMIKFLSDPDIHISEKIGKTVRPLLSIEIRGGRDASNVFNRLGEAEKSHQTARVKGFCEFWTIIGVEVNLNRAKEKSPTTSVFSILIISKIQKVKITRSSETFSVLRLVSRLKIALPRGIDFPSSHSSDACCRSMDLGLSSGFAEWPIVASSLACC